MWKHVATQHNRPAKPGCTPARPRSGGTGLWRWPRPHAGACPHYCCTAGCQHACNSPSGSKLLQTITQTRVPITAGPTAKHWIRALPHQPQLRQMGYAIAAAAQALGADVTLVSGPVSIPAPAGVNLVRVESAQEMLGCLSAGGQHGGHPRHRQRSPTIPRHR
ncbi:MAG: phosphopantothenoylcysteine decarboxylase [Thiolinea sp.]